ncbi:hypothetical protein [Allorhodopirellula heiligendammensis]|nr:hypothetical protein [Allorhodopirellula heiligendammensis]
MSKRTSLTCAIVLIASTLSAEEFRSDVPSGHYTCNVTSETLNGTPQWHDIASEPPLAIQDAIQAASKKLKTLKDSDAPVIWRVRNVSLKWNHDDSWFYIVTFKSTKKPEPKSDVGRLTSGYHPWLSNSYDLQIPVMLNGQVPTIAYHSHTVDMTELLESLEATDDR